MLQRWPVHTLIVEPADAVQPLLSTGGLHSECTDQLFHLTAARLPTVHLQLGI